MNTIKIEVLYGEFANLFGEMQNVNILEKSIIESGYECEIIHTKLHDKPRFLDEEMDMVYLGAMTENQQELVVDALKPYVKELKEKIEGGLIFLFTGNALEVTGKYIENEDGSKFDGLGIFDIYSKRDMMNRYNSLILGEYEGMKLVGFKAQFSHSYGDNSGFYFFNVNRGDGLNPSVKTEGVKKNNFFGTYLVGPFLVLNPLFVKYLMGLMGIKSPKLFHEDTIMKAYNIRLKEFEDEKLRYQ